MVTQDSKDVGRLLCILDALTVTLIYIMAYELQTSLSPYGPANPQSHLVLMPFIVVAFCWGLSYAGAYRRFRISVFTHAWMVASGLIFAIGLLLTVLFLLQEKWLSRLVILIFSTSVFIVVTALRALLTWWYFNKSRDPAYRIPRVLIVGSGERASKVADSLLKYSEWGVEFVGFLDTNPERVGKELPPSKVIGTVSNIAEILKNNVVDEVIIAVPRSMIGEMAQIFATCEEEGVKLRLMADIYDFRVARTQLELLGSTPLLSFEPVAQDSLQLLAKRLFDICAVLLSMPLVLPLIIFTAIAVKLDSPGPIFFVQQRVGLRKRIFPMFKFRSMHIGSEEKLKEIEHLNEAKGPIFKITNDPRVTRVGKFIRKTSIDEIPQLLNVLLGHMSLVGPRPMSVRDVNLFDKSVQRKRFSVTPGLTCLWQISGRSNLPFEKWLELDLTYVDHWSFRLDMEILFKTIPVILKGEGAV